MNLTGDDEITALNVGEGDWVENKKLKELRGREDHEQARKVQENELEKQEKKED